MQISGSTYSALPVPVNRRDDLSDRRHGDRRQSDALEATKQTAQQASQSGEVTRIRPRADTQRPDAETRQFSDLLTGRGRAVVDAYRSNGPSLAEQYGVELAGIDVYA